MRLAVAFVVVALAAPAAAQSTVLFKHDQFATSITEAATEIEGQTVATNQGFVAGEAFGQLYQPDAGDYPLRITGIELILAAPPNGGTSSANAHIEFWFHDRTNADPGIATPTFSISTTDLYDRVNQTFGQPLQGNTAMQIEFDWSDENDLTAHPPVLTSGNFTVMIRFDDDAQSLMAEWGTALCMILSGVSCGCQEVGTIQDQVSTTHANVLHILASGCDGDASQWVFADESGVSGDFVLRVRGEVGGACVPSCGSAECGDDGCGGSCGTCDTGSTCDSGTCVGCTPDCSGRVCGDDGCGGSCGACAGAETCSDGTCVPPATDPEGDDEGGCAQQPGGMATVLLGFLFLVRRRRG